MQHPVMPGLKPLAQQPFLQGLSIPKNMLTVES